MTTFNFYSCACSVPSFFGNGNGFFRSDGMKSH